MRIRAAALLTIGIGFACSGTAHAFRYLDLSSLGINGVDGVSRWDASLRTVSGVERSLVGGLRYSIEGQSYESFRNKFAWSGSPPSVPDFEAAVKAAFAAWEVMDPETGQRAAFEFTEDLATAPVNQMPADFTQVLSFIGLNAGAEVDVFADNVGPGCQTPPCGFAGVAFSKIDATSGDQITLTSGVTSYNGFAISGSDIVINTDISWNLTSFQNVLTHEIGHALGISDADLTSPDPSPSPQVLNSLFIDDNYDGSSSATALATLTNSFEALIDPLDPDLSPGLSGFTVPEADPGIDTPGVDILMESTGSISLGSLQNDEFAARQFLYPWVPNLPVPSLSPLSFGLLAVLLIGAGAGLAGRRFSRR